MYYTQVDALMEYQLYRCVLHTYGCLSGTPASLLCFSHIYYLMESRHYCCAVVRDVMALTRPRLGGLVGIHTGEVGVLVRSRSWESSPGGAGAGRVDAALPLMGTK